jgi:hypothetical protein
MNSQLAAHARSSVKLLDLQAGKVPPAVRSQY